MQKTQVFFSHSASLDVLKKCAVCRVKSKADCYIFKATQMHMICLKVLKM